MARDFQINGPTMVYVKGRSDSVINVLTELGLAEDAIDVRFKFYRHALIVDAWGEAPVDYQMMGATADIYMNLIHFDDAILDVCMQLSQGGTPDIGTLARAGQRLGSNLARFAVGNNYIGLNMSSPVEGKPYRFYYAALPEDPVTVNLGAKKKVTQLHWEAIPYIQDPYQAGLGSYGQYLYDNILDT